MTQKKIPYVGRQSGKSSAKYFGGSGRYLHEKGNGASAGDGETTDKSVAGKITPEFKDPRDK